jgi:hypothetical protein
MATTLLKLTHEPDVTTLLYQVFWVNAVGE